MKSFNDSWAKWIKTFYTDPYVNIGDIIEKLIVIEFIKFKTVYRQPAIYRLKIDELKELTTVYLGKKFVGGDSQTIS